MIYFDLAEITAKFFASIWNADSWLALNLAAHKSYPVIAGSALISQPDAQV